MAGRFTGSCPIVLFCVFFGTDLNFFCILFPKELLDIRTAFTNLNLDKGFYFNESEAKDILIFPDQA